MSTDSQPENGSSATSSDDNHRESSDVLSAGPGGLIDVRIIERRQLTDRVDEFTFAPIQSNSLPHWSPGSHIDVHTPAGVVRQYSLTSDPMTTATIASRSPSARTDAAVRYLSTTGRMKLLYFESVGHATTLHLRVRSSMCLLPAE